MVGGGAKGPLRGVGRWSGSRVWGAGVSALRAHRRLSGLNVGSEGSLPPELSGTPEVRPANCRLNFGGPFEGAPEVRIYPRGGG